MLRSLKFLDRYTVHATDGDIGTVVDFLLDDERWAVRYLVVETGGWLNARKVLISPISFRNVERAADRFDVDLTVQQVRTSPDIDAAKPVSRQREREFQGYFGYRSYWGYSGLWGMDAYPRLLVTGRVAEEPPEESADASNDVHLRSAAEVRGYHIHGSDDGIGHIVDFVVDDVTWRIQYLVVATHNWWFGKKVLIAPQWATDISWVQRKVQLDLSREEIQNSPEWNPASPVNREYETRLYDYYGRPVYWSAENPHEEERPSYPTENHPS